VEPRLRKISNARRGGFCSNYMRKLRNGFMKIWLRGKLANQRGNI